MTQTANDSIDVLSRALGQATRVLSAVRADQLDDATPCRDWTVARLVGHLVVGPSNFVTMAGGGEVDWSAEPPLPADWTAEFRTAADQLLATWRQAGDAASPQAVDWQTAEFAVHAWDLARATGQSTDLDPEVAQRGLDFMSAALTPENRRDVFGAAVTVPAEAPVYERLVAFAGRDPR